MDIGTIIFVGIPAAIGWATILFRTLDKLTPLTETKKDDNFVKKALAVITFIAENVSFNKTTKEIKVKVK